MPLFRWLIERSLVLVIVLGMILNVAGMVQFYRLVMNIETRDSFILCVTVLAACILIDISLSAAKELFTDE